MDISARNLIIVGFCFFLDGLNCEMKGIITGMGLQKYSAWIFFISFWIVSLPLSALLVLAYDKGISFVWGMKLVGSTMCLVGNFFIALCTNWDKLITTIQERLKNTQITS